MFQVEEFLELVFRFGAVGVDRNVSDGQGSRLIGAGQATEVFVLWRRQQLG